MAVIPIRKYPDPILRKRAVRVDRDDVAVSRLLEDLVDTLRASPGCVGIAAPQVGALTRVIAVDASRRKGAKKSHGLLLLQNPEILYREGGILFREGCLSLPDYTANVRRAERIVLRARDAAWRPVDLATEGFEAIVIQHEIDHLDGILFIDRMTSFRTDLFPRKHYR